MKNIQCTAWAGLFPATGLLGGCSKTQPASADAKPTVAVVKVARRNLADDVEIASEFQPCQEIEVYAKISGYIQELHVNWGTHVIQGQLLAVLEVPELQQQLQQDEATLQAGAGRSVGHPDGSTS